MAISQIPSVTLDRPMPHSPDAERAILGAVLINNHAFYRVIGTIDTEDFFKDAHRTIFATMRRMAERSQEIETLTLKEELAKHAQLQQAGGVAYISSLVDVVPDIANVERYADIIKEKSKSREVIALGNRLMQLGLSEDVDGAANDAEGVLLRITTEGRRDGLTRINEVVKRNLGVIEAVHASGRPVVGVPTGFTDLDELTAGFHPSNLVILAARPSMGKTSLMTNIAEAIAVPCADGSPKCDRLYSVGLFSLEMTKEEIGMRSIAAESGVSGELMRSGLLSQKQWERIAEASQRIAQASIYVDDTPGIDPLTLAACSRRMRSEVGLDIVMVDYLQLMQVKGKSETRQQEVSQISRSLKGVAKTLGVPVLALSQLSRRSEQRTNDHRPQLSDLRESGAIEQDADLVCFIYRDEVYNKDSPDRGTAELIVAKQRNGPTGMVRLAFESEITKFVAIEAGRREYVQATLA